MLGVQGDYRNLGLPGRERTGPTWMKLPSVGVPTHSVPIPLHSPEENPAVPKGLGNFNEEPESSEAPGKWLSQAPRPQCC